MQIPAPRFHLRDLPLPARVVLTVFLLTIGLGYLSALIQLHFKHASKGNVMPSITDVVENFSGQRPPWLPPEAPPEQLPQAPAVKADQPLVAAAKIKSIITDRCATCHGPDGEKDDIPLDTFAGIKKLLDTPPNAGKFHKVINKDGEENFNKDNMVQAFTRKSEDMINGVATDWKALIKLFPEAQLRKERETERKALLAWLEAGAPESAYLVDAFPLPAELRQDNIVIIRANYLTKAPDITAEEKAAGAAAVKKKSPKERQLSVENLTQSTHAHLLTFALLWTATGLIFAFTSYPLIVRLAVAPIVLIAQVVDVLCWWLARIPDIGPYFAVTIVFTGAVVGMGLMLQILMSIFNMYTSKGRMVLAFLAVFAIAGVGTVYIKYLEPELAAEKRDAESRKQ